MPEHTFGTQLSNRESFIRQWEMEHGTFIDVFKALPPNRLDYRPHAASRSAAELVALLVSLERSCVGLCESGRGAYNSSMRIHPTAGSATLEEMITAYEGHHHALAGKLINLDDVTWN